MAFDFNANGANFLSRGASLIDPDDARPFTAFFRLLSNVAGSGADSPIHMVWNNNYNAGDPLLALVIRGAPSTTAKLSLYTGSYSADSNTEAMSTSAYESWAFTWDTDDSVAFYKNGAAHGTASVTPGTAPTNGENTDGSAIGTLTGADNGFEIDGDLADFAVWNRVLSVGEIATVDAGSPLDTARGIVSYVPMVRDGRDYAASAWTENGTLTARAHPPVRYRTRRILGVPTAAGPAGGSEPVYLYHHRHHNRAA